MTPPLSDIRIIADDLTGALDAAAPFAAPGQPVGLVLPRHPAPARPMLTISTESRDLPVESAGAATAMACATLGAVPATAPPLWMKKVDSVLRGHPFAETAQALQTLGLARCIFAPAFPAMGRVTQGGYQMVRQGTRWMPTEVSDIVAGFASFGILAAREADDQAADATVIVIDANTQADLDDAVRRWAGVAGVLWAGSRGLAEALAGPVIALPPPQLAFVVIGTTHPATRAQVTAAWSRLDRAPDAGPIRAAAKRCLLIDPVPVSATAAATRQALHDCTLRLDVGAMAGRGLFVAGGDTLSVLLDAAMASSLDCLGEVSAGLPLSIIRGGALDGIPLVSKSGGFGDHALIARMVAATMC